MQSERKGLGHIRTGLGHIRTMNSRMDRSKKRTPQEAFMELAKLSHERERLGKEMAHWERRIERIKRRLAEIAQTQEWLHSFVDQADLSEASDSGLCPQLSEQRDGGAEEQRSTPAPQHPGFSTQKGVPAVGSPDFNEVTLRY